MRFIYITLILCSIVFADKLQFSFITLEKGDWHIVVCNNSTCDTIQTQQEPRTYDYDFVSGNLVYIASDKNVHIIVDKNETILLESRNNAYTEPLFIDNSQKVMLVELINGNSKKTKIISIDIKSKQKKVLHSQFSTALEPYSNNDLDLYYANVSCVEGCGKIIQEIWYKNLLTQEAEQLTLLNSLSHQPRSDTDNDNIYFSSNKNGNYHIWIYNKKSHISRELTSGDVTDSFPAPTKNGVYFLRRIGNDITLMCLFKNNLLTKIQLKQSYRKIRNLKVKQ